MLIGLTVTEGQSPWQCNIGMAARATKNSNLDQQVGVEKGHARNGLSHESFVTSKPAPLLNKAITPN